MNRPQASVPNIFTFLWRLWKARNDTLFCRKTSYLHQVHQAALAIASTQIMQDTQQHNPGSQPAPPDESSTMFPQCHENVQQGCTLKSDLAIAGTKIFPEESWKKKNIPGQGNLMATGQIR